MWSGDTWLLSGNISWTQLLLKLKRGWWIPVRSWLMTSSLGHRVKKMRPPGELGKERLRQLPQGQVLSEASYSHSLHMCLSLIFEITFPRMFFTSISVNYCLFLRGLQTFSLKGQIVNISGFGFFHSCSTLLVTWKQPWTIGNVVVPIRLYWWALKFEFYITFTWLQYYFFLNNLKM